MNELESLKKKILYRANYRGTKEMDIILGNFVKKYINSLSLKELKDLDLFLDFDDDIIYNFYQNNVFNEDLRKNKISEILLKSKEIDNV
tara:strand:+ start:415 stop:681 length:267 start_codon:yes stop_codon:yes gene_type:complete